MTSEREITPPPGFSVMHITTTMFAATTPENKPLAYRASTSTNHNPVISPAFVEANYETLEFLLRDRRRQMYNNDLRTELEYFSEDYNEEREMEPRPEPARPGKAGSKGAAKVEGLQKKHQEEMESSLTSAYGGQALPNNIRGNLPPNAHELPSANSDGKPPIGGSFANLPQRGHIPSTFKNGNILPLNVFTHPTNIPLNSYPFYTLPMSTFPNMSAYANPNLTGLFPNPLGSTLPKYGGTVKKQVTSLITKISKQSSDHTLANRRSSQRHIWLHITSNRGKTKAPEPSLLDTQMIPCRFWACTKTNKSLRTRSLVKHLFTDLPPTYKGLMEKMYTWVEAKEVATNGVSNDRRDRFERPRKSSWNNNKGQIDKSRSFPYKGESHKLLSNLVKSPREILIKERVAKTFERLLRLPGSNWSKDKTRYYHFHKDYGHETNKCQELKHQIEEAIKTGQLTHLVKGVTKKREKTSET
ncbi:hypothetical protein Tco_1337664 [Tanacetum coccineum]